MAKTKTKATEVQAIDAQEEIITSLNATIAELNAKLASVEQAHKATVETMAKEADELRLKSLSSIERIIRKAHDRYEQVIKENNVPLVGDIETGIASRVKANVVEETEKKFRDVSKLPAELQAVAHYCARLRKMARNVKALNDEWSVKAKGAK